jgi:hypothetical protein
LNAGSVAGTALSNVPLKPSRALAGLYVEPAGAPHVPGLTVPAVRTGSGVLFQTADEPVPQAYKVT